MSNADREREIRRAAVTAPARSLPVRVDAPVTEREPCRCCDCAEARYVAELERREMKGRAA